MDFRGKVIFDLPEEGGTSKAGNPWRKKAWVLETEGMYPKKVKVDAFGQNIDNIHMEVMKTYDVSVDAESREFNGRWYTDLRVYRAQEVANDFAPAAGAAPAAPAQPAAPAASANPFGAAPAGFPPAPEAPASFTNETDDLPF